MATNQINLLRIYLKGASLEQAGLPLAFMDPSQPQLQDHLDMQMTVGGMGSNVFEVSIRATLTLKREEATLVVLEAEQGALVQLVDVAPQDVDTVLNVQVASAVYGHLRVNITDILTRATLPALYLPEVDWEVQLQARLAQAGGKSILGAANDA